jgi:hypothetical protein
MVAYSFAPEFRPQVAALIKRQTVRAHRKRHARPGEPVQLYAGMRTKHCRKLVDTDPLCTAVRPIEIHLNNLIDELVASIAIDGRPLNRDEIEAFAVADGFSPEVFEWSDTRRRALGRDLQALRTARANMGLFWLLTHGECRFEGVVVTWEPAP